MIRRLALVVFWIVSGCAHTSPSYIQKDFQPYLMSFNQEAINRNILLDNTALIIRFSNLKDTVAAQCLVLPWTRLVSINPDYWSIFNPEQREILVYHELGHCLFNRFRHVRGRPSIMNPQSLESYNNKRESVLDQFFEDVK